jgi:5-methylcytosine-specific restriction endonuclease McrA
MLDVLDSRVLKLNKGFSPIGIVTARDAFEMLYTERAEVVTVEQDKYFSYNFNSWAEISEMKRELEEFTDVDDVIFTTYLTLQIPRVIRTLHYEKVPRMGVKLNRKNVYIRDNNTCQYCGKKFVSSDLTLDHVVPRSQGGANTWDNLVCACFKCNQRKAGRTPKEARMHLVKPPMVPKYNPNVQLGKSDRRYSDWMHFISDMYWNVELISD